MRKLLLSFGGGLAVLALAGYGYYSYTPKVPPPPKDLTKVLPKEMVQRASPAQLAVLRGEAASAPKETRPVANAAPGSATPAGSGAANAARTPVRAAAPTRDTLTPAGLTLTVSGQNLEPLKGQVVNQTGNAITCAYPAGTLFSNGVGDVVLLRDFSVNVPAKLAVDVFLPVAAVSSDGGVPEGRFAPHEGTRPELQGLLTRLALKEPLSPGATQTAVLAVTENVPLDIVASFPRMRPMALSVDGTSPFRVSNADLLDALFFLRAAGVDTGKLAMMTEPPLRTMTMLDPQSHAAAAVFFGLADDAKAWDFWRSQLLDGDPSLRHFALYGIARYYPQVALVMLPQWVRTPGVYREYRLSAAWALALVDDPRAPDVLRDLQREFKDDAGLSQSITRALRHCDATGQKVAGPNAN